MILLGKTESLPLQTIRFKVVATVSRLRQNQFFNKCQELEEGMLRQTTIDYKRKFPDGSELYCFKRYGTWKDADIDGLHNLINPEKVTSYSKKEGRL